MNPDVIRLRIFEALKQLMASFKPCYWQEILSLFFGNTAVVKTFPRNLGTKVCISYLNAAIKMIYSFTEITFGNVFIPSYFCNVINEDKLIKDSLVNLTVLRAYANSDTHCT